MARIHIAASGLARIRFAPRPAPLQELNAALLMMSSSRDAVVYGRWRYRTLRSLPPHVGPLADLARCWPAPSFLDSASEDLDSALAASRDSPRELVQAEIERVFAAADPPAWVRELHRGEPGAWHTLARARRAAFHTVLGRVWPVIEDLHRDQFCRFALAAAGDGIGPALAGIILGGQFTGDALEFESLHDAQLEPGGSGLVLLPTFHWTGLPLVAGLPDGATVITYPAGPGWPVTGRPGPHRRDALAEVLGRTRSEILAALSSEYTTTGLARLLNISNATASAHAGALRKAGLVNSARTGRSVGHRRTVLGDMLIGDLSQ